MDKIITRTPWATKPNPRHRYVATPQNAHYNAALKTTHVAIILANVEHL